jgi:hypothetical protein
MSITAQVLTEQHGTLTIPADPYKFAKAIQYSQPKRSEMLECLAAVGEHTILFNKGRYFETSIYNPQLLESICSLTNFKPCHTNMIVQSWKDLEDFVIAMNILGIYVYITVDWI